MLRLFVSSLGECATVCMDHGLCRGGLFFKLFNMITSLSLLEEGARGNGWISGSKLCSALLLDFILFLILMVILLLVFGLCIYELIKHHSELYMYQKVKSASLWGIVCAAGTWLICFLRICDPEQLGRLP